MGRINPSGSSWIPIMKAISITLPLHKTVLDQTNAGKVLRSPNLQFGLQQVYSQHPQPWDGVKVNVKNLHQSDVHQEVDVDLK